MTIYIDFGHFAGPTNVNKTWNSLEDGEGSPSALLDETGAATGFTLSHMTLTSGDFSSSVVGTGDASWIDEGIVIERGWAYDGTERTYVFSGLDDTKIYKLVFFGSTTSADRVIQVTINGTVQTLNCSDGSGTPNTSEVISFTGISPTSGQITYNAVNAPSSGGDFAFLNAMYIEESTAGPAITLTNPPQLGATLSGTGSNYAAQPTGPISITQGARSLPDMPITVSAWDAGTGSFNWTTNAALPGLPANGADTTPFVLTGEDVTITLPDPGA